MTGSFVATPVSISSAFVLISRNLNTSPPLEKLAIVFVADTVRTISPVCTATSLIETVTWSVRYCSLTPIPKYLAPAPPDVMFVSYPTIPPSTISPANFRGFN